MAVTRSQLECHCASYYADRDEGADQDAQAASFSKVFGMSTPFTWGSPPDSQ